MTSTPSPITWAAAPCAIAPDPSPWLDPGSSALAALAAAGCRRCPALDECEALAQAVAPAVGVWAGVRFTGNHGKRQTEVTE